MGGLPDEIVYYFRSNGGHSLLVKGPTGAGKTMFALQLALELRGDFFPFYVSPHISRESMCTEFPALAPPVLRRERIRPISSPSESVNCAACGASINVVGAEGRRHASCPVC